MIGGAFSAVLAVACAQGEPATGFVLEIEAANAQGGTGQLFYDVGQWYTEHDSCRVPMPAGTALRPYRFLIPPEPIIHLRFDPADGAGIVRIGEMRLLTADGKELARFGPECLKPMHTIESLVVNAGVARVVMGADDPMLSIARPVQRETELALERRFVSPIQVFGLALIVALLVAMGLFAAVRSLVAPDLGAGWVLVGTFLTVFGARLHWLLHYSNPVPFWDEWHTDAITLLIPIRNGLLDWRTLFMPQEEHRILFTRLLNLGSVIYNGEWDPRVGMTVSSMLFAAGAALLCAATMRAGRLWGPVSGIAILSWSCLPFDTTNLYWGDQSQMYALYLLGLCILAIAASERIGRMALLGGFASGLVSLFTMASGLFAPAIGVVICMARWQREPQRRRNLGILSLIFLGLTFLGVGLFRDSNFFSASYARTWAEFWPPFKGHAAWPLPPYMGWAVLAWVPWIAASLVAVFQRQSSVLAWFALGVGMWGLLNAAALAHGRPLDLTPFDPKYYTAMSLSVVASILSAAALVTRWPARRAVTVLCLLASLATVVAMDSVALRAVQASKDQLVDRVAFDRVLRRFLATGDSAPIAQSAIGKVPYWNGPELVDILNSPNLEPWLPAPYRRCIAQRPGSSLHGPQTAGDLTIAARSLMKSGIWLFLGGSVILLWHFVRTRSAPPDCQSVRDRLIQAPGAK